MKKTKILVVDDDPFVREILTAIIESENYRVDIAENGEAAFHKCVGARDFDLIVSDLHMPVMGGVELIRRLRDDGIDIPIVVLTANNEISTALDAIKNGADDYLLKDQNIQDTVLLSIDKVLEKRRIVAQNVRLLADLQKSSLELKKMNDFITGTLKKYLSPEYVDILINQPELLELGGDEKTITCMFTDLEGFTALSETMSPKDLVSLLNDYLDGMTEVLLSHGGTLDKFQGDALMAFWNAPLEQKNHAELALTTALHMLNFTKAISENLVRWGKPVLRTRIGINTGKAIVGNIGSRNRFNYTAIGDDVNLTSRIEQLNKVYRTSIIITESSYNLVKDVFQFRELDYIRVRGKNNPVKIYELLGNKDEKFDDNLQRALDCYKKGLTAYKERRWCEGAAMFSRVLEYKIDDRPASVYLERCYGFDKKPPPDGWDFVCDIASLFEKQGNIVTAGDS